jgi:hypothetical protein
MECLPVEDIPEGDAWTYELKLDGYRMIAVKSGGQLKECVWVKPPCLRKQNGRHERMHRTLKEDTAKPPAPTLTAQQKKFDRFRLVFNHERPHEA